MEGEEGFVGRGRRGRLAHLEPQLQLAADAGDEVQGLHGLLRAQEGVVRLQGHQPQCGRRGAEAGAARIGAVCGDTKLCVTWAVPESDGGAAIDRYDLSCVSSNGGLQLDVPPVARLLCPRKGLQTSGKAGAPQAFPNH